VSLLTGFKRNIEELEEKAVKWWTPELREREKLGSVIPLLLESQDQFISILKLSDDRPTQIFEVLNASDFPANLFLKHLSVLADYGGEQIQRLNLNFRDVFSTAVPLKGICFDFFWNGQKHEYYFLALPFKGTLNNAKLGVDGKNIFEKQPLDDLKRDMVMILLFGSNAADPEIADILQKCEIGNLLGKPDELEKYVRQRYIWVSRITGGAKSNALGQVAQQYVAEFLGKSLPSDFKITRNGHIEGVTHTGGRTLTSFDIVVERNSKAVAVEVSFQVTTNSVIERKAGQAKSRYDMIKKTGNYIAYVIDGAGNFQRKSAVSTICNYSDCTVGFSDEEFKTLTNFIVGVL